MENNKLPKPKMALCVQESDLLKATSNMIQLEGLEENLKMFVPDGLRERFD